jgi:C-terminal processing protease CtpA/Prc
VRRNGGGSTGFGYRVLSTLTDKSVATTRGWKMVYRPTDRARQQPQQLEFEESQIGPDATGRLFRKPVAVLIGPGTFSAAEDFAAAWKMMKRGLTIGTASGGSTGQPLVLALPGGGGMRICTKRDRFANGDEFVGIGIKPDVEVRQTLEEFRAGRDAVLERAIAELSR